MSPLDPPVPPAGEEIHLPGAACGHCCSHHHSVSLFGITIGDAVMFSGLVLTVSVIIRWIADTRRDIDALPADHEAH